METLDLNEFSNDGSITCLPPDPVEVTDEENIIENDLDDIIPADLCGKVEVKIKKRDGRNLKKKQKKRKNRKISITSDSDNDKNVDEGKPK